MQTDESVAITAATHRQRCDRGFGPEGGEAGTPKHHCGGVSIEERGWGRPICLPTGDSGGQSELCTHCCLQICAVGKLAGDQISRPGSLCPVDPSSCDPIPRSNHVFSGHMTFPYKGEVRYAQIHLNPFFFFSGGLRNLGKVSSAPPRSVRGHVGP